MKKVGMVVGIEEPAISKRYGNGIVLSDRHGTVLYQLDRAQVYMICCGPGEIVAAASTQFLIDKYDVDLIINYGVAGGCSRAVEPGDVCVVESVIQFDYDISAMCGEEPCKYVRFPSVYIPVTQRLVDLVKQKNQRVKKVICASGDKLVADPIEKTAMYVRYGTEICDMEAAGIAITCFSNNVPCLVIKFVDKSDTGKEADSYEDLQKAADNALCVMESVI